MDSPTLIGSTIGFVLAMLFLTHALAKYEDFLNDKKLARGFAFGFIAAVLAYIVEQVGIFSFNVQDMERDSPIAFVSIFGIAILHTALKGMALNHNSLWDKKDMNVPFYGAFFGFIFGAVYVTVIISKTLTSGEVDGYVEPILLFLLALGMIMFQGSTSIIMGWGVPKGKLIPYFIKLSLAHIFMNIFIFLSAVNIIPFFLTVLMIVVYGFFLYGFCYQVVLPDSLTNEQRKELFPTERPFRRQLSRLSKIDPGKREGKDDQKKSELSTDKTNEVADEKTNDVADEKMNELDNEPKIEIGNEKANGNGIEDKKDPEIEIIEDPRIGKG